MLQGYSCKEPGRIIQILKENGLELYPDEHCPDYCYSWPPDPWWKRVLRSMKLMADPEPLGRLFYVMDAANHRDVVSNQGKIMICSFGTYNWLHSKR